MRWEMDTASILNLELVSSWQLLAKEKSVFSSGVSLGIQTTLRVVPIYSRRWQTQNKLSGIFGDCLNTSGIFFFFAYVLWFLILCFMCVCVCACVHVFSFPSFPSFHCFYLPACFIKREGRHDGGGGENLGGDERGSCCILYRKNTFSIKKLRKNPTNKQKILFADPALTGVLFFS